MEEQHETPTPEELERLRQLREAEESKHKYTPRPKWQIVGAWILIGIMVLGIVNVCYWQITGIPSFLLR